jgi:hypothetical protein
MMTDKKQRELSSEWNRLMDEMEKAQNNDQTALAASYEASIARIEQQLGDVDPREGKE